MASGGLYHKFCSTSYIVSSCLTTLLLPLTVCIYRFSFYVFIYLLIYSFIYLLICCIPLVWPSPLCLSSATTTVFLLYPSCQLPLSVFLTTLSVFLLQHLPPPPPPPTIMSCVALSLLLVLSLAALTATQQFGYHLPLDFQNLLRDNLITSFSCEGRPYGYYADVENDCIIFHICNPVKGFDGEIAKTYHYSFICNHDTMFDQKLGVCNLYENSFPCHEADSLYNV